MPESLKIRAKVLSEWRGVWERPDPRRNLHTPKEYVESLLKNAGIDQGFDQQKLESVWQSVAGEFVAKHARPESLKHGILVLHVVQPTMRFELQQQSGRLLRNLQRDLGKNVVRQIRFKIG
ncbi:DUF721 domain-containing protein [Persicirhabdus sediminis]|uniref:DUF721 domain-containing protein n=1 Tax=Persicirhabdus sediminis TaxID=454144 RepID=A0A8J7SPT2_9BACT|nr:DUF721 domain-containing protein [Persicirhabdus sediminis]MBK1792543.1 DUF721 domain-containing protein [Persicirhabdus sediminis]